VFQAIRAIGYDVWITIELYPYVDDPDAAARTALHRVRELGFETTKHTKHTKKRI